MKHILVIEDQHDLRENIAEILELSGYRVSTAANGKEGVALAREAHPDVILCDIMMPELDGYGVLHVLTRDPETARIPFIFLTAKTERDSLRKGMSMGADDYLTKPFEDTELLEAIEARLKRMEMFNVAPAETLGGFLDQDGHEALNALRESCRTRVIHKKDTLYHAGEDAHFLYYLKSGRVKRFRGDAFGKELVTSVVAPGEFFGHLEILSESPHPDSAAAMEDAEVELIPAAAFSDLVKSNREVAVHFIKWLSSRVSENEERLLKLAYQPVRERTADVLLSLFDQAEEADGLPTIQVSRDDLASLVGTATESLIRVLSGFKQDGLISSRGRSIQLVDRPGLEGQILG